MQPNFLLFLVTLNICMLQKLGHRYFGGMGNFISTHGKLKQSNISV